MQNECCKVMLNIQSCFARYASNTELLQTKKKYSAKSWRKSQGKFGWRWLLKRLMWASWYLKLEGNSCTRKRGRKKKHGQHSAELPSSVYWKNYAAHIQKLRNHVTSSHVELAKRPIPLSKAIWMDQAGGVQLHQCSVHTTFGKTTNLPTNLTHNDITRFPVPAHKQRHFLNKHYSSALCCCTCSFFCPRFLVP